jgi:hypothetical protein
MLRRLDAAEEAPPRFDWVLTGAAAVFVAFVVPTRLPVPPYYLCPRGRLSAEWQVLMNTHPYLRAFLAGAFVPTVVLPLILTGFIIGRLLLQIPVPIQRGIIFPMALVPSLFGLWNMLWVGFHERTHLHIGLHGAVLPILGTPTGALVASGLDILVVDSSGVTWFNSLHLPYALIAPVFLCVLIGYYLIWKYIVGFVNRVLGVA